MSIPQKIKVLVLNNDYTPLNTVRWENGIKMTFDSPCSYCGGINYTRKNRALCDKCGGTGMIEAARVVEYYDLWLRDSMGNEHPVPAVIVNRRQIKRKKNEVPYSKKNVFKRDGFKCQYCGQYFSPDLLTIDHVIPRSIWRGNTSCTHWKNVVACCIKCNRKKANRTPEQAGMKLIKLINGVWVEYKYPKQPSYKLIALGLDYNKEIPKEWIPYIGNN